MYQRSYSRFLPVLLVVVLASACGAWDVHAYTALSIRDASNAARAGLLDARANTLRSAGTRAQISGGSDEAIGTAIETAAAAWDSEHQALLSAHAVFATASNAYSSGVYAAMRGQGTEDTVRALGRTALEAYNRIAAILREDHVIELPELPEGAIDFLGAAIGSLVGDTSAEPTATEDDDAE